ncbi:MAG: RNA-directed DNA polymerase, partial [SAR86 cluster bacterium]
VDEAYDDFIAKLTEVIDKMAPTKMVRIKGNTQEWFDDEIHNAIKIRDKCFSTFKKSKKNDDKVTYKRAQNYVQCLIKKRKKQFVKGKLDDNIGKPKELWKTLKSLGCSKKDVSASKICLKKEDKMSFDSKENSESFKDFFSNLASNLVNKLPPAPKKFEMNTVEAYYKNNISATKNFSFSTTEETNIFNLLKGINPTKAAGLDNIAGKFLKEGASVLATPVTQICNLSISLSAFPDKCKHAKLKPLFKKGATTEAKNYRPISLLPLISKIIEKVIHDQTQKYLDENKIIYKYQSGFRSNHSTNSCLSFLCNKVQQGFERGMLTGMILIDLQKAFDTIDHQILLKKMRYLGFSDSAINWFRSYLENRTFSVQVEDSFSSLGNLECGVPQGSILGPLLFLLYVNDMSQAVTCDLLLYADDSCLVFEGKDINEIENRLNRDFNTLCDWFVDNKLSIHFGEDKTKSIVFGTNRKMKNMREIDIRCGDVKIKQHPQVVYLGCILDSRLSGEAMALQALGKINGRLKFLYRKKGFLTPSLKRLLCNALIQPHFDFACLAWYTNLKKKLKKKVQICQNKCIRFCLDMGNRDHIGVEEFKKINWLPTKERFEQCLLVNIYKFFNKMAPKYFDEMYYPVVQSQKTRFSFQKLMLPFRSTNRGLRTLGYLGPRLWNGLHTELKSSSSVNNFKHKIKNNFFALLQKEEDSPYIYY